MSPRRALLLLPLTLAITPVMAGGDTEARSDKQRATAKADPADLTKLVGAELELARDLIAAMPDEKGNLVLSPLSIYQALAMAAAGAKGDTAAELAKVLKFPLPPERIHAALGALEVELMSRASAEGRKKAEPAFTLNVANALFGQTGRTFEPAFLELLATHYGAGMQLVDYQADPDAARKRINGWVSEQTRERIPELLQKPNVTDATRLVLVNAVYFLAKWDAPFEKEWTKPGPFTRADGSKLQVERMNQTRHMELSIVDGARALKLPYKGGKVACWIVLPSETAKLDALVQDLPAKLPALTAAPKLEFVSLSLPKLKTGWRGALVPPFQKLGMSLATNADKADFSGMDGTKELFVGSITHQTFLAVDEEGTEAAAATAVEMTAGGVPPKPIPFAVDRPFLLVIRDEPTGAVLFLARIMDPSAN